MTVSRMLREGDESKSVGINTLAATPVPMRPTTKANLHAVSFACRWMSPAKIPLMPAILPVVSKKSDAESPISAPPTNEA